MLQYCLISDIQYFFFSFYFLKKPPDQKLLEKQKMPGSLLNILVTDNPIVMQICLFKFQTLVQNVFYLITDRCANLTQSMPLHYHELLI